MLNIFVRAAKNSLPLLKSTQCTRAALLRIRQASFTVREILNERSDETGTLLTRFAKHIAIESHVCSPLVPTTIRYADFFPVTDLRYFQKEIKRIAAEQLPALIIFASTYRSNADPIKFAVVLNEIDAAATQQLPNMNEDTALRTLYALLFLIPNWITRTDFYHAAIRRLAESDFTAETPKEKFVQLCFYLGLGKKNANSRNNSQLLQNVLEQHLEKHLPQLSTIDLAVVSNAAYKTATSVQNATYNQRLEQEVLNMPLDSAHDALLVSFVKAMRFQRVRSEKVCEHLTSLCTNSQTLQQFQSTGIAHLFAYFAENLWNDKQCTESLVAEFMRRLGQGKRFDAQREAIRTKDIATFLWSCAQLNCTLTSAELQRIEAIIVVKESDNEFRYMPDQFVDCCLSLWSLGHKSRDLFQQAVVLKQQYHTNKKQQREQPKVDSRLTVLLSAAGIEEPTWLSKIKATTPFNLDAQVPAYLLKNRADITNYAKKLSSEEGVAEVKVVCPINGINMPGLLVRFDDPANSKVFVELQTNEQTLRFSQEPIGMLRLKTRLLTALGYKVITLRTSDLVENYTSLKDLAFDDETADSPKEQSVRSI